MNEPMVKVGQRIRVDEPRPVAEGIVRWIEDDAVCVTNTDGDTDDQEVLFARGDMPGLDEYIVTILAEPEPPPEEPPVGTHWLGSDGCVYTHYHGSWNNAPWCGPFGWDMTWAEVWYRANPLIPLVPAALLDSSSLGG